MTTAPPRETMLLNSIDGVLPACRKAATKTSRSRTATWLTRFGSRDHGRPPLRILIARLTLRRGSMIPHARQLLELQPLTYFWLRVDTLMQSRKLDGAWS